MQKVVELFAERLLTARNGSIFKQVRQVFATCFLILTAGLGQAQETPASKSIDLVLKNVTLKEAFQTIQKKSNVRFVFSQDFDKFERTIVSIHQNNITVDKAINTLLRNTNLQHNWVEGQVVIKAHSPAALPKVPDVKKESGPMGRINGVLQEDSGVPVSGATVKINELNLSTNSNEEGKYSVAVPAGVYVVEVTHISHVTQNKSNVTVKAGEEVIVDFLLQKNTEELSGVVVVGYGKQKKVNLTGAVSQISGEGLENRPVTNLSQALQGVIPNLNITFGSGQPGTQGTLNIRGNTSINGGSPLVLIDGIEGAMDRVNVDDVESVTVLKDASSAAVYGARAAFGVILITTKSAKQGKTSVNYNNSFGTVLRNTNTDFITSGYLNAKINDETMYNALGYTATRYTEDDYQELLARINDKEEHPDRPWVVLKENAAGQKMYRYYGNFDWYNYFYSKTRPNQDHTVSVSGASDKVHYLFSGSYSNEKGIFNINTDDFDRYNFRGKIGSQINKWLSFSNNIHLFNSSYDWYGFADNFGRVSNTLGTHPIYSFLPAYLPKNPDGTLVGNTGYNIMGNGLNIALENGTQKGYMKGTELTNISEVAIQATRDLKIVGNFTYRELRHDYSYRQTKGYYSLYPGVQELFAYPDIRTDKLTEDMYKYFWKVINVYGTYNKRLGYHDVTLMAGFNQEDRTYKRVGGSGQELLSATLSDLSLATGERLVTGGAEQWALRGGFYRFNYNYAGKYLVEASGRYDGSSRFPKSSRFGFFPSFSAGWRLSEEQFFEPLKKHVNDVKFRYSYGSLGNQDVSAYAYISTMGTGQINYLVNNQRLSVTNVPAPVANSLTWENVTTSNFGIDILLLQNRLSFTGDYYIRNTKKMLSVGKTLPDVFGAQEPRENSADLRTKGFEITLGWKDRFLLKGKNFSYGVTAVLSDYTSKITRFDNPGRLLNNYYAGQQLGEIWGYSYDGIFRTNEDAQAWAAKVNQDLLNNRRMQAPTVDLRKLQAGDIKVLDLNGDGIINGGENTVDNPGDRRIIGNAQPRYSFGLTLNAAWNGIDFSILFQGIGKQNWYPSNYATMFWQVYSTPYISFIPTDFQEKMWSPDNLDAYFPLNRGYIAQNAELAQANDMYLQDLAYCKLRNLTIGYSLSLNLLRKVGINKLRIFTSGENLFTWTKLETDYLDPEQIGYDPTGRTYPFGRILSVGAQLSF